MVGDGLEDELALDLEHVADLVEDPGEVAVGQLAIGRIVERRRVVPVGGVVWRLDELRGVRVVVGASFVTRRC